MTDTTRKAKDNYKPQEIESKWQQKWQEAGIYEPDLSTAKRPFYNLFMFPYPSAEGMHVGNMFMQTGSDIYARFHRMNGFDTFQPTGLDGFGIHAENYALKIGANPMQHAQVTEENFYRQMRSTGSSFSWNHKLETYDIDYYRWTQWLFIELFKAGLAYRAEAEVNWCPSCKTVLADEQVIDGKCERCNSEVEKKLLAQWFFRITAYAEELLQGLDKIDWTEKVKIAQRNWIGKSEGARIKFSIINAQFSKEEKATDYIEVFTTRPDTLYGATFVVISPQHPLAQEIAKTNKEVATYIKESEKKSEKERRETKEKSGVFSKAYAINPINHRQLPIWIADYVLMGYGTGAIMAVPAHDQRDFEFAKKYSLPIQQVIAPETGSKRSDEQRRDGGSAVIFDPKTQKYAVADYPDGLYRLYGGGVDDGEDLEEAITREVTEESGLYDFDVKDYILTYFTHYRNNRKRLNRVAMATTYLFILKSTAEKERHLEPHEVGMSLVWKTPEEILKNWEGSNTDGSLTHWIDSLKRSVARAIELGVDTTSPKDAYHNDAFTDHEGVLINSGEWNGVEVAQAISKTIKDLEERGIGSRETTYHLRDWLISRQRYWGPPIPMVYCESCAKRGLSWFTTSENSEYSVRQKIGKSEVSENLEGRNTESSEFSDMAGWFPEEKLPVELPYIDDYKPLGTGRSPLGNHPEFYETTCPHCGGKAKRETDVSDTFLDSAWYFLRYLATDLSSIPFPMTDAAAKQVIHYSNVISTTDKGRTLGARLLDKGEERSLEVTKSQKDFSASTRLRNDSKEQMDKQDIKNSEERTPWLPVTQYIGGAEHSVLHLLYTRFVYKVLVDQGYIDVSRGDEPFPKFFAHGLIVKDGAKMSKSKGNVVIPDQYIKKFGADTLRTYLMFLGPFSEGGDFRDTGIEGMYRFLKRVWVMSTGKTITSKPLSSTANAILHKTIKGVTNDIKAFHYNTAIAKIMTLYNALAQEEEINRDAVKVFLQLLAPFAPHMTEELWARLEFAGKKDSWSIHTSKWPEYDESALVEDEVTIVIQVNGKLRDNLIVSKDIIDHQKYIEEKAKESETVKRHLEGKTVKKVIYVPGKILNFVL